LKQRSVTNNMRMKKKWNWKKNRDKDYQEYEMRMLGVLARIVIVTTRGVQL
jgi:hypothetical protein